ncbi:MAG: helix-hairpin-helix domain-containing protein [Planctomycetes bacterium]|nr:helix-hairpin-helix domain-containing protein [Planctomycetota bacterium]
MAAGERLRHSLDLYRRERLVLLVGGLLLLALRAGTLAAQSARTPQAAPFGGFDCRLDLNQASAAELRELPGIGLSRARALVRHRAEQGGFRDIGDLRAVLPDSALKRLAPHAFAGHGASGEAVPQTGE